MNSRQKGARGEREFRNLLRENGYNQAHRGQQFCGLNGNADVVCPELPALHFEVKRTQRGNLYDWIAQASADARDKMPIVAHKRNHADWLIVLRASDFFEIVRRSELAPACATVNPPAIESAA